MKHGLVPSEYWEMSYDELNVFLESMVEKEKDDYKKDLQISYYQAVFSNTKEPHKLYTKLMNELDKKEMSSDEMQDMAKKLNAMFGGKTVKKGGE